MEQYRHIMDVVGTSVDGIGVLIVVGGALVATCTTCPVHRAQGTGDYYSLYRQDVGRAILLGLEFLIAGDLIRTVVVAPTMQNVAVLGLIVSNPHVPKFVAPTGNRRKAAVAPRRGRRTSGLDQSRLAFSIELPKHTCFWCGANCRHEQHPDSRTKRQPNTPTQAPLTGARR